ncbi:hypothetical protein B0H12DRAFT_1095288 [Mycena haematopus]|nr:hypothetical protein B0H12DRAFT_1095288 [Mycena haematopus]
MAPPRGTVSSSSPATSAVEYTHTLDSLPLDLSRNFADLRELDAVLSASMSSITTKISKLTEMIEQGVGEQGQRLWLLMDIAEEATRLRLGGEDKIRVACQAADNLRSHSGHLRALTEHIPGFDLSTLSRRTTYPHVGTRSFMPVSSLEPGRRRRTGFVASLLVSAPDPSPVKRKRAVRDDDLDQRSARKERAVEPAPRPRNGGRKKVERAPSPTESLLSVTSHIPPQLNARASGASNSRAANGTANKRSRTTATRGVSNQPPNEYYNANNAPHEYPNGHAPPSATANARREAFNVPPSSSSHPSLIPYPNGHAVHATPFDLHPRGGGHSLSNTPASGPGDWHPPHPQTLEGPGMPVARSHANIPASLDNAPPEAGDGEADGDDKPYCFCQRVSFGQMIACDDSNCQWEWFHIACIGLTTPPDGRWFCDACRTKRNAKRAGRGGRRKPSGRARA